MNDRRLLILDAYDAETLRDVTAQGSWDVLLLGLSESWFRWRDSRVPVAGEALRFIDPVPLAPRAHERIRAFATETIDRLPEAMIAGKRLADILEDDLGTTWWYTEISEKGPYRSRWVYQLYQLALIDGVLAAARYREVIVASRQDWLCQVASGGLAAGPPMRVSRLREPTREGRWPLIQYWRHALSAACGVLLARLIGRITRWPVVGPAAHGLAIFSFYPAWWAAAATDQASERFFSAPPPDAWFFCWLHAPFGLWNNRHAIRRVIAAHQMLVLQRCVPWRAVLRMLSPRRCARTWALWRRLPHAVSVTFCDMNVTPLIVADLTRSLTGGERFQGELLDDAVASAARRYQPRRVLFRAEFQPSERAIVAGLRGLARTAGFIHYPYGRNYLPVWDTRQPRADDMLACGDVGRRHMVQAGYPDDRIAMCGPQRHAALLRRLTTPRDRVRLRRTLGVTDGTPVFFVGIAIVEADTEALFGALAEALAGFRPCRLRVRTHPNRPAGDEALQRAVAAFGADRAAILGPDVDLYDAIEASDAAIMIGSTLAFETMALGCMPVVFENPSTFAANTLREFTDALYVVHDAASLREALEETCAVAAAARQRRARWADAVNSMLGDLSTPLPAQLDRALETLERGGRPAVIG